MVSSSLICFVPASHLLFWHFKAGSLQRTSQQFFLTGQQRRAGIFTLAPGTHLKAGDQPTWFSNKKISSKRHSISKAPKLATCKGDSYFILFRMDHFWFSILVLLVICSAVEDMSPCFDTLSFVFPRALNRYQVDPPSCLSGDTCGVICLWVAKCTNSKPCNQRLELVQAKMEELKPRSSSKESDNRENWEEWC